MALKSARKSNFGTLCKGTEQVICTMYAAKKYSLKRHIVEKFFPLHFPILFTIADCNEGKSGKIKF